MFSKKSTMKKGATCAILTVGALAAIGACTVKKCGENMLTEMKSKISGMFSKSNCSCGQQGTADAENQPVQS